MTKSLTHLPVFITFPSHMALCNLWSSAIK